VVTRRPKVKKATAMVNLRTPRARGQAWTLARAAPGVVGRRDLLTLLLAIAGGCVDAVVILGFGVLTAAQTGNTVLLAVALAQGQFVTGVSAALSVLGYVAGAAVGELVVVGRDSPASGCSAVRRTLLAELVPLGGLLVVWYLAGPHPAQSTIVLLVALAAIAMGMQSAAVLRLHAGPTTTYVTGTLTTFATRAIQWLPIVEPVQPATPARRHPNAGSLLSPGGAGIYGVTWVVYAVGAILGALLYLRGGGLALVLAIIAIVGAVVADSPDRAAHAARE
jgi:uncharacterized membrane protein YoaK (UPF0700 family)